MFLVCGAGQQLDNPETYIVAHRTVEEALAEYVKEVGMETTQFDVYEFRDFPSRRVQLGFSLRDLPLDTV